MREFEMQLECEYPEPETFTIPLKPLDSGSPHVTRQTRDATNADCRNTDPEAMHRPPPFATGGPCQDFGPL
jgi:hypothetical protein